MAKGHAAECIRGICGFAGNFINGRSGGLVNENMDIGKNNDSLAEDRAGSSLISNGLFLGANLWLVAVHTYRRGRRVCRGRAKNGLAQGAQTVSDCCDAMIRVAQQAGSRCTRGSCDCAHPHSSRWQRPPVAGEARIIGVVRAITQKPHSRGSAVCCAGRGDQRRGPIRIPASWPRLRAPG